MGVLVGVKVSVTVGVLVGVKVGVRVGLFVGVKVGVGVGELVGVFVGVYVSVTVGVFVGVFVVQPVTETTSELDVTGPWPLAAMTEVFVMASPGGQPTIPHQVMAPEAP